MFVQLYIPRGSTKLGRVIDTCVARCVEQWGGCTLTDGVGHYREPGTVSMQSEPVAIVNVYVGLGISRGTVGAWFDELAEYVRGAADQRMVYYQMFSNARGRFVGPHTINKTIAFGPEGE